MKLLTCISLLVFGEAFGFTRLFDASSSRRYLVRQSKLSPPFNRLEGDNFTVLKMAKGFGKKTEKSASQQQAEFQSALAKLQAEDVPILGCDADQPHSFSAAIWTTLSEVSESNEEQKMCVVFEKIPMSGLASFIEDFSVLKMQQRLIEQLPELERISVSLLEKGVGPALVIETAPRTDEEIAQKLERSSSEKSYIEENAERAMRSFVDRLVVGEKACPFTKDSRVAGIGLEAQGIKPGPVGYRFGSSSEVCAILASFWTSICELMGTPEDELSTILLCLPAVAPGTSKEAHDRFAAVVEVVGRYLFLFKGAEIFGLVHFHPAYDRSRIQPFDKPAFGHLPPRNWLRPIIEKNGNEKEANNLTDEELELSDYQRRAPFTMINILRNSQVNAAAGPYSIVDLPLPDGTLTKASGILTYSRNTIAMATKGKQSLQSGLEKEMSLAYMK